MSIEGRDGRLPNLDLVNVAVCGHDVFAVFVGSFDCFSPVSSLMSLWGQAYRQYDLLLHPSGLVVRGDVLIFLVIS